MLIFFINVLADYIPNIPTSMIVFVPMIKNYPLYWDMDYWLLYSHFLLSAPYSTLQPAKDFVD